MDRRQLIQILGAGIASGRFAAAAGPRFLTRAEYETLDRLCDLLIPADASAPGARDAGVPAYIDLLLEYGAPAVRESWRAGLAAVDGAATAEFEKRFVECAVEEQAKLMDRMAAGESRPESAIERFFVALKAAAIQGFSLAEEGRRALGYRGDRMDHTFTGCTHPEHRRV